MEHSQTAERLVGLIPGMHARERRQRTKGPTPAPRGIENRDEEKHEDERKKNVLGNSLADEGGFCADITACLS